MRWLLIGLLAVGCAMPTGDGPAPTLLTFINGLGGYDIVNLYFRPADTVGPDSYWPGGDRLFHEGPLEPGESISFEVEPDYYDLRCVGELGATYTLYDVEIPAEGYSWEVTQGDRDG